jgi:hypothetical protein
VFENRVLRRIFGPKRDEVTEGWRKLQTVPYFVFFNKNCKSDQIMKDEFVGACIVHGGMRNAYKILVEKPEGKRPLGRPRRRWDNITRIGRTEIVLEDVDWIHWAQDRDRWRALVNTVMILRFP